MRPHTLLFVFVSAVGISGSIFAADAVDFQREVRPILADNCYKCHGPDAATRKGKLRLDTRADALKGGRSKEPAIVPGKPEASDLIIRVESTEETEVMPPPKSGKKLTPQQATVLRRWVAAGAPYRQHWALVPPVRPVLPKVHDAGWMRTPIDALVLARLQH